MGTMVTKTYVRFITGMCAVLVVIVGIVAYRSFSAVEANLLEGLVFVEITPRQNLRINAGGSITFTSEGDFGTFTIPIKSDWSITQGGNLGSLSGCNNVKTCEFTAGNKSGNVTIRAQAGGGEFADHVGVTVVGNEQQSPRSGGGHRSFGDIKQDQVEDEIVNPFVDELPEWAFDAIIAMYQKGIIKGYDDGQYGPGDPVTIGQVVTLLHRMLIHMKLIEKPTACRWYFDDVPFDHYAFLPACTFRQQGWATRGRFFRPDIPASRGITAAFLNRVLSEVFLEAMDVEPGQGQIFSDVPVIHLFHKDIAFTYITGFMTGYPDGRFGSSDNLNRAAIAVVMDRIMRKAQELEIY